MADVERPAASPQEKQVFEVRDRAFSVTAFSVDGSPNARVVITRDGQPYKTFYYPAYRIWNIAAHFGDIVDAILGEDVASPASTEPVAGDAPTGAIR